MSKNWTLPTNIHRQQVEGAAARPQAESGRYAPTDNWSRDFDTRTITNLRTGEVLGFEAFEKLNHDFERVMGGKAREAEFHAAVGAIETKTGLHFS